PGERLTCTPQNEHQLLFQMVHGTFGTLGIISRLTFKLVPAKPFVRLDYERYDSLQKFQEAIWLHYQARDLDFMDGFAHAPDHFVINAGRFTDEAPYTHRYDWARVYYQSTRTRKEDYLATPHYFFRYDRGVTNTHPKSLLARLLFGPLLGSSQVLWL